MSVFVLCCTGGSLINESSALFDDVDGSPNQPNRAQRLKRAREQRQTQLKSYYAFEKEENTAQHEKETRVNFSVALKLQDAVNRFDTTEGRELLAS